MIIGSGGSGKTTLSRQLGDILNLVVIHLDSHYWKPEWIDTPTEEWNVIVHNLAKGKEWIIDGNYGNTMEIRLQAADTIIFLDFSRFLCLWRVVKRRIQNAGRVRPDMGAGCLEKIDWHFIKYVWTYPKLRRPKILQKLSQYNNKEVICLHNAIEVKNYLKKLSPETKANRGD